MYSWDIHGGPDAVVKAACLVSQISELRPPIWHSSFKETQCFFPAHSKRCKIMRSPSDRAVACSASDRHAQISNPVSGGQCHLIHLTILSRLYWPSLAYVCTKVAYNLIHFTKFTFTRTLTIHNFKWV